MSLEIRQEQEGPVRILTLTGRLDTETAADLELNLQDLLGAGERYFLLDLGGIGYVSSAGLRVLLGLAKQLDGGKGSLRLCALSPAVKQVFDVAGFSKLFAIFPQRASALGDAPKVKPEALLAQRAAQLLGVTAAAGAPRPQAIELARLATLLLGVQPSAVRSGPSARVATPAVPKSAFERQRSAAATGKSEGLWDKVRRLFGAKS